MQNLIPDTYHGNGTVDWIKLSGDPQFIGAVIKATEGVDYKWADTWFIPNWRALRSAGNIQDDGIWLSGCYHYLIFEDDPIRQAEFFLCTVETADPISFDSGTDDIMPIVDVELGSSVNRSATASQVVDSTSTFVSYLKTRLACPVMLYGHQAMAQLNIKQKMECDYLWLPTYSDAPADPQSIGWDSSEVLLWQYTDGVHNRTKNPITAPGMKAADISITQGAAASNPKVLLCRANDY